MRALRTKIWLIAVPAVVFRQVDLARRRQYGIGFIVTKQFSGVQFLSNIFDAQVSADVAILVVAVAAAIGLDAGIYPAARAANLNPIAALRHE